MKPQVIHSFITCKVSSLSFHVSFVYGFHSIVSRRPLWNNLMETTELHSTPWLLVGDFNSLLRIDEKWFGAEVSAYEVNDFMDCCQYIISDSLICNLSGGFSLGATTECGVSWIGPCA
ncbi:hypothetical protein Salmi_Mp122 (mitochondrion) [Salvia miltiorrhiza]|uniref:Endonuclease/exonuclease/phosphatase n=1 Tax=Salvia miltiorrhiza TaxID=226208 RepID=V9P4T7_SALMI|nr:hypothetical protein Salmi_Mp122 [Salvia miltiorrhiza]AGU16650.1 hypothetical protein Salmi_Mp122 [Salvia miltiorrhiza]